ncbi:probable sodium/metabolite cotransporter BASS4, chloroplastic [Malania oleifera]|uniref:probable sodium/metabolite cotransporter BASS4, chloroplastic n=1 Tax=Malania oleifera TaxID=397392 RepID=UPI0025AE5585|nr:probable sodium/metabolite cotransporter BASS4, chloroplastic [Malania oleifera]
MAGSLQSLCFRSPATVSLPSRRWNPHFQSSIPPISGSSVVLKHHPSLLHLKPRWSSPSIRAGERSAQTDGNDDGSRCASNWVKPLLTFASNNFLPLALVSGVALGLANPNLGCLADRFYLSKFSTFGIFLISGLMLRGGEIGAAAEAWPVGIFGLGSILLFTPFFSRLFLQFKIQPQEFVTGLAIFSCMPTTLSSGVALTQLAGGNSALALAMTVISNLLGILIVPFSISKFIADGVGVSVPTKQLFKSLVVTLLIPLILGKVFRESIKGVADFVDQNRKALSMISAICLSLVPWIQVSKSRSLLLMVKPAVFLVAIGMGLLLHLMLLAFNILAVQSLSAVSGGSKSLFANKQNASALVLVASQKTLPVMVAVVDQLGGAFGESGLLVLPCVAAHLNQIITDSILVNFWLQEGRYSNNARIA